MKVFIKISKLTTGFIFLLKYPVESLIILIKTCRQWLSFTILRHLDRQQKAQFRILERLFEKITKLKSHLIFNETCINNQLLPTYTNIYISKNLTTLL